MADNTRIEWTDATWNVINGCQVVSPGCTNCYAMRLAGTRLRHHPSRKGLTDDAKAGPVWNGQARLFEPWLRDPLRWQRPRRVFVCAHGDLFYEGVPDDWIERVFKVMEQAPQHQFQVLTKRAARMREFVSDRVKERGGYPTSNVWLGVSVEDQRRAEERVPHLLETPAAVRWVSAEPLLGAVDLMRVWARMPGGGTTLWDTISPYVDRAAAGLADDPLAATLLSEGIASGHASAPIHPRIDWVVVGGESGPGARPMHLDWARALRDQCQEAGVPFLFKQWGGTNKKATGRTLDGVEHNAFPPDDEIPW